MRRTWTAVLSCASLAATIALAQQAPPRDTRAGARTGTAEIGGTVVADGPTPTPVANAEVGVLGLDSGLILVTTSRADGRFALSQLAAGRYLVSGFKPPFISIVYGATQPGRPGTAIALGEGEQRTDLVLKLARGGVITGVVTDDTGSPAPGMLVTVMPAAGGSLQSQVLAMAFMRPQMSDDRGTYRATSLPAGEYVVSVRRGDRTDPDARVITAADIEAAERLLREPPSPAVSAVQPPPAAETSIAPGRGGRGGTPNLSAGQMPMLVSMMAGGAGTMSYAPVYYPGTVDAAEALPVKIAAGEERTGIDIVARAVPTSKIEGIVIGPDGQPASGASLRLRSAAEGELMAFALQAMSAMTPSVAKDGTFTMNGVAPGRYTLEARTYSGGAFNPMAMVAGAAAGFTPPKPQYFASTEVVVTSGQPLTNIELRLQTGSRVTGSVVFRPTRLTPPKDASSVMISLVPAAANDPLSMISGLARVSTDGTFSVEGVIPGRYVVTVGVADASHALQWMPESLTVNGREMLDLPIEITPGEDLRSVVVTLADVQQELHGTLQDASGRPAPEFTILLFPADRSYWIPNSRRVLSTRPATDGRFSFTGPLGPAPGEYLLAALTDLDPQDQYKPSVLAEIAKAAIKVTVVRGEKTQQDIRIAK